MSEYIKLKDLYGDDVPDENELLWQFVCSGEYEDTMFEIVEVDPVRLFNLKNKNGNSIKSAFKDHAEPWQKKLVREYRNDITSGEDIGLLVVSSGNVVDGHHRIAALALEGVRKAKAVDLELPKPKDAQPTTSANPPRTTLYHITKTSSVKSIVEHGIQPLHTSNWVTGIGKRYGEGEIFAFEHIADAMRWASRMDWEFHKELGTKKISIVEFINDGGWEADKSDPISQIGRKGNWLKRFKPVSARNVVSVQPFTKAMVKKVVQATNPPPHLISREYGGWPDPSNEDPQDRVTISIEQPEDITSEAIQDTKLDLFFDKISKFARGTPGIYKAFGLPSPDPVYSDPRTSELERHEPGHRPDVMVAMMFGITADQRLTSNREKHAEELSEVMSELIKAAFDEAKQRGAYGVFARGGFAEKHRLLVKNGFTPTGVRDGSGYGLYVKILNKPEA